jgi:hypothetical protein
MAFAFIIPVTLWSLSFNALALAFKSRDSVYRPVLVSTQVEATWIGWEMIAQRREKKGARNALRLKARMKEVPIMAMEMGTWMRLVIL